MALVLATAGGFVLRCSLGEDWRCMGARGRGICAIRVRPGDSIASCGISEMTEEEIHMLANRRKRAAPVDPQAPATAGEAEESGAGGAAPAAGSAAGTASAAAATAPGEAAARRRVTATCDDDDSDNGEVGGEAAAAAAEAPDQESDADADGDGDEVDSDGEKAVPGSPLAAQLGAGAAADVAASTGASTTGQCALLITAFGMGVRMPLSVKRIGLSRRGTKGRPAIKLADGTPRDTVAAVCIVSSKGDVREPERPHQAWQIYLAERKDEYKSQAEAAPAEGAHQEAFAAYHAMCHAAQEKFKTLPEVEQQGYVSRQEEQRQRYEQELEEYRHVEVEEVLLGSVKGLISRVKVGSIPVMLTARKGVKIAKLPKGDSLCAVSLLPATGDNQDEQGAKLAAPGGDRRAARPHAVPRVPAVLPAAEGGGAAASRSAPSALAAAAAPAAPAAPASGSASAAATAPARFGGRVQPPGSRGMGARTAAAAAAAAATAAAANVAAGAARSAAALAGAPAPGTPEANAEGAELRRPRRLRRKTSSGAGLKSRLSHMMPGRPRAAGLPTPGRSARLTTQRAVRLSIVKPKLRLLSKTRKSLIVRSLDVTQWAMLAAAALAAPEGDVTAAARKR